MGRDRRLLIVAGEASADALAAATLEALGPRGWWARGMGGARLAAAGATLLHDAEAVSVMGMSEVVPALPRVLGVARDLLDEAARWRPDVALLVDLPDFNLRLGPRLARRGVPVVYLGAPQAWAWRPGRARAMARWVHALACLYPFEEAFFRARGVAARFVGHPRATRARGLRPAAPGEALVVMPGSRRAELARHAPALRAVIPTLARRVVVRVPVAPTLRAEAVVDALGPAAAHVTLHEGDALEALATARLALVASGTAVTEATLMGVPAVVFYRVSAVTYAIARRLVRTPHVAMANLLAGERLLPELIQDALTPARLLDEAGGLLDDPARLDGLRARLLTLAAGLEGGDDGLEPAARVARMIEEAAR